jgi:hypothetical protein
MDMSENNECVTTGSRLIDALVTALSEALTIDECRHRGVKEDSPQWQLIRLTVHDKVSFDCDRLVACLELDVDRALMGAA